MDNTATPLPARIHSRVTRALGPRQTVDAQNAWNLYADIAWYGVLFGVWQAFLAVYTIRLGGSDTHVGLLSALPALVTAFASIPGSRLIEREKKPLSVLLITVTLHRVGFLALGLIPFFLPLNRADVVVAIFGLITIPQAIANVAFTTMFAQAVKPEQRPRVVSLRNVLIGIVSTATALIGGRFLDRVQFPGNYQLLFTFAFVTSMMSTYYLSRLRLPEPEGAMRTPARAARGMRGFIAMLRASPAYVRFTVAAGVIHLALFFAIPLYSIYWVRILRASEGWVGLISMVGSATTIFFFPIWGRLTAQYGNRVALIVASLALAAYPLFTVIAPSLEWLLVVSFWGGVFTPGFSLALFNGLLEVTPEQNRAGYIAAFNSLVNVAAFVSPVLSSSLTSFFSVPSLLLVGAGLRLLGGVLLWKQR